MNVLRSGFIDMRSYKPVSWNQATTVAAHRANCATAANDPLEWPQKGGRDDAGTETVDSSFLLEPVVGGMSAQCSGKIRKQLQS